MVMDASLARNPVRSIGLQKKTLYKLFVILKNNRTFLNRLSIARSNGRVRVRGLWRAWEFDRYPEHEGPKQMRTEQTFLSNMSFTIGQATVGQYFLKE